MKREILEEARKISVRVTQEILEHIDEFKEQRSRMVELISDRDIKDKRVLFAMSVLPRHIFIPERFSVFSYDDSPVEIGFGQTISQPYITAFMTEQLEILPSDSVLEIGTGSGYHTAILSMLSSKVVTIEYEETLSARARGILEYLGLSESIRFVVGDGSLGFEEEAPYDKICISSAAPDIPPPLLEQLREGGIMVIPIGETDEQILCKIIKESDGKGFVKKELCPCRFVKMKGRYGFK